MPPETNKLKECNSLAEKLSEEGSQQQKEEIENDQTVQSMSHHGLPTLWKTHKADEYKPCLVMNTLTTTTHQLICTEDIEGPSPSDLLKSSQPPRSSSNNTRRPKWTL